MRITEKISAPVIGKSGELRVRSELLKRGIIGGHFDIDMGTDIVLDNGIKIGVKSAYRPSNDKKNYSWKYSFSIRQPEIRNIGNGLYKKRFNKADYTGLVDYWVLWCINDDIFYIVPNSEVGQKISLVVPTPDEYRIYKKQTWKESVSKYEKYKNNWDQLIK